MYDGASWMSECVQITSTQPAGLDTLREVSDGVYSFKLNHIVHEAKVERSVFRVSFYGVIKSGDFECM